MSFTTIQFPVVSQFTNNKTSMVDVAKSLLLFRFTTEAIWAWNLQSLSHDTPRFGLGVKSQISSWLLFKKPKSGGTQDNNELFES